MSDSIVDRAPAGVGLAAGVEPSTLVVRVLGPVRVPGLTRRPTSQQLALITRLAAVGPADRGRLIDDLWDGRPVSAGRFANVVAEVRSVLGPGRLPEARLGRYALHGVTTDLELLTAAAARSGSASAEPVELRATRLASVLDLVSGPVLAAPGDRWWRWLDAHPELVARAEVAVGTAAVELVGHLVAAGRLRRAQAVCERALTACRDDDGLLEAMDDVLRRQRRPGAADEVRRRRRRRLARFDGWSQAGASTSAG